MFDLWFDRSIGRMVEYAAMLRRISIVGLLCVALIGVACSAKPITATRPAGLTAVATAPVVPTSVPLEVVKDPLPAEPASRQTLRAEPAPVTVAQVQKPEDLTEQKNEPAPIDELLSITTVQPEASAATTDAVAEDLVRTAHDINIPLNARVLSFVELFSGRLKGYLEDGLGRGAQYLPMIQEIFRDEGLPLDLAYVPLIESGFKTNALSRAKAKGIWQFMRGTGLENGLSYDWYLDERSDPEKATRAAAKYLKTLYGQFGDWHLALASYNGGPGRVQRAMARSGKKDFWTLTSSRRYLPRETRDYVPLILAAVVVAKNPAQYGLVVDSPTDILTIEPVMLPTAVDLRLIAEWVGLPVESIREMNPELRRWTTPLRAADYELNVPEGMADLIRERLVEFDPEDLAPVTRYTVKKGETLVSIAKKLGVTRTDLAEANYLKTSAKLATGQRLVVPRAPKLQLAARPDGTTQLARVEAGPIDKPAASAAVPASRSKSVHRVKSGETLTSIARLYQTTVASLKEWNELNSSTIRTGQRLTVYSSRTLATD
jgi:membrane-bound lytic murein transglycosylase D